VNEYDETATIAEETGRDPKRLLIAGVGAALVGVLLWLFVVSPLLAGADTTEVMLAAAAQPDTDEAPAEGTAEVLDELPLVTYEVFLDRDPFDPVVPEPIAATEPVAEGTETSTDGTATDGATDGTATDGTPTDGVAGGQPPAEGTPPAAGPPSSSVGSCVAEGDDLVCNGRVVSLIEIRTGEDGSRVAIIQVDTTIYEVAEGETFAGNFVVQSISETEVYIQYGDDVDRFEVGDRILK
jgi:hypothetical protein